MMGLLMGTLEEDLRHVDIEIAEAIQHSHLRAQLTRIAVGVLGAVVLSLASGGAGPLDWRAIAPVALGALWTQLAAVFPAVPWEIIRHDLELPRAAAPAPPGPTAPGGGGDQ